MRRATYADVARSAGRGLGDSTADPAADSPAADSPAPDSPPSDSPAPDSPDSSSGSDSPASDSESPVRALIGKPQITLPLSQLSIGRTAPPWNARSWKRTACAIREDFERAHVMRVRLPGGCDFDAAPRCFPATDVTMHYAVRFERRFAFGEGGTLPCAWPGCAVRWCPEGRLALWARDVPLTDHLTPRGPGRWNDVVVRLRAPSADGRDGIASISVNGRVVTAAWRTEIRSLKGVSVCVRGRRDCKGGVDLSDFWLV